MVVLPGAQEAVALLPSDYLRFVVTNQPDIRDGMLRREDLIWWHEHLEILFNLTEIRHAEVRGSSDYKPNVGMVLSLMIKYNVDPRHSFMIGDRWKDIDCGHRARLTTIFVGATYDDGGCGIFPNHIVPTLTDACQLIVGDTYHDAH